MNYGQQFLAWAAFTTFSFQLAYLSIGIANGFTLDQVTLHIERVPDTVQTDHFDWGFRLTNLCGFDYRFTTASRYFSQQLLNNPQPNGTTGNKMGYDPVMAYVDLYVPQVADGMIVRIGRYISLPDIEPQLAPNNCTYTHSLTYTYDCYRQAGVNATIKLNERWTFQAGLSGGCEAARWSPYAKLTGNLCVAYTWSEGRDNYYACANSINDGDTATTISRLITLPGITSSGTRTGTWPRRAGVSMKATRPM